MVRRAIALALLLSNATAATAGAELAAIAYGSAGELFEVHRGSYASLFPQAADGVDPENPALRLDVTVGGTRTRYPVIGTEGPEIEGEASLVYEAAAARLFLLWGSRVDPVLSSLYLASFADGEFSEPIEVSGDPVPLKGPPHLALTRDTYGAPPFERSRSVVHLLWWEDSSSEIDSVYYTPIVLLEGEYLGWNLVLPLASFDPNPPAAIAGDPLASLYSAANIEPGRDAGSVVVTLPRRASGRILTLEIRLLPYALLSVADDARVRIPGFGSRIKGRSTAELAEEIRDYIAGRLGPLHAGVLHYVADEAYDAVLASGDTYEDGDLNGIAAAAWDAILDGGASLVGREVEAASPSTCEILHLGATAEDAVSLHQIELCLVSDRPAPGIGPGPVTLSASESGADVLLLWEEDPRTLRYRLSEGPGWSEPHTADLGASLDMEAAKDYLRQLIRTR